jgi:hypothetical protein
MSTTKLTLSIDKKIVDFGKKYAEKTHTSLSKMFQRYLQSIAESEVQQPLAKPTKEYSQWIKDLTLSDKPTPDFDHKAEYGKHIEEKYGL